jgi:hypothetical protein
MAKATKEHKPVQPGCKQAVFSAAEWAPCSEAFARAKAALGSGELAGRDLIEHLRNGRLESLVRRVAQDGSQTCLPLKPSDWEGAAFSRVGKIRPSDSMARMAVDESGVPTRSPPTPERVRAVSRQTVQREPWVPSRNWFNQAGRQDVADQPPRARLWPFVARAALDRLYPVVTEATKPSTASSIPRKEGWQERHVKPILCEFWPPDGKPPAHVTQKEIVQQVGNAYQKRHGRTVSRHTILRAAGRLT